MIGHVAGCNALPREIADQIIDRTDGVPLFIEELTKSVVESGLVTEVGDRYAMARTAASLAIPKTLHAIAPTVRAWSATCAWPSCDPDARHSSADSQAATAAGRRRRAACATAVAALITAGRSSCGIHVRRIVR
jgi:hypothetical protein